MKKRLLSLDVFRGMTVFFMIIVNSTGNWSKTYAPLLHAKWHGFTPTDLVFPSFLFAVGCSLAIVMDKMKTQSTSAVYRKIITRTAIIFLLGFLMYWFPFWNNNGAEGFSLRPFSETRIMGVLQRIALAYGLSAILCYHFTVKTVIRIAIGILIGYWLIMMGFGDYTMSGNAAHLLDMKIIGANHLYKGEGVPFDPEGLFSTLPCIGNVIAGYATVFYLRKAKNKADSKLRIALIGGLLIGLACLWHYGFPINKKIWTSSYVLLTSGINVLMIVGLHVLVDMRSKSKGWANFFTPMGKNPLFIYVLSQIGATLFYWFPHDKSGNYYSATYENLFRWAGDYLGAFLFALSWTMICWTVALIMDKRKLYVRV